MAIKIGFIVPTMNRPKELNRLLQSLYKQTVAPSCIIIVDGSQHPINDQIVRHSGIPLIYNHCYPPSLTKQRNVGIGLIPDDVDFIGYLDDDLLLLPDALEQMQAFIAKHGAGIGGASFNIVDEGIKDSTLGFNLKRHLGVYSSGLGNISKGGSIIPQINLAQNLRTDWLCGGATVWNCHVLKTHRFDEWYKGYALWEDIDFSFRVGKEWDFYVVAGAKVKHLHVGRSDIQSMLKLGDLEVVDRFYFVKKHRPRFRILSATWAVFGTMIWNFQYALRHRSRASFARVLANFKALLRCLFVRIERVQ